MTIVEYAAKFEELVKFCPYYNGAYVEGSKCIKCENGLRPKINHGIGYQEIHRFPTLVNKFRIYNEDYRARYAHYKSVSGRNGENKYKGKPYSAPADRGKQRVADEKKPSGEGTLASVKYFKCGELGHRANECKNNILRCFKCGKTHHYAVGCMIDGPNCHNYSEQGHISTNC